jgi:hypothetical protein
MTRDTEERWFPCLAVLSNLRVVAIMFFVAMFASSISAQEPCRVIPGRAHKYSDGPLRIWHIGTHHDYQPDESSWQRVEAWIEAGVAPYDRRTSGTPYSTVDLYADFLICPTQPFKRGAVQSASVKNATHRRYVRVAGLPAIRRGGNSVSARGAK